MNNERSGSMTSVEPAMTKGHMGHAI